MVEDSFRLNIRLSEKFLSFHKVIIDKQQFLYFIALGVIHFVLFLLLCIIMCIIQ